MKKQELGTNSQIAIYLKRYRKIKGLSQLELEIMADLSFGTICRIENGKINPTKETLIKIANVLALTSSEILNLLGF